jgi:hypothetical protein
MVAHWPVDAKRIGAFGFSLGVVAFFDAHLRSR